MSTGYAPHRQHCCTYLVGDILTCSFRALRRSQSLRQQCAPCYRYNTATNEEWSARCALLHSCQTWIITHGEESLVLQLTAIRTLDVAFVACVLYHSVCQTVSCSLLFGAVLKCVSNMVPTNTITATTICAILFLINCFVSFRPSSVPNRNMYLDIRSPRHYRHRLLRRPPRQAGLPGSWPRRGRLASGTKCMDTTRLRLTKLLNNTQPSLSIAH